MSIRLICKIQGIGTKLIFFFILSCFCEVSSAQKIYSDAVLEYDLHQSGTEPDVFQGAKLKLTLCSNKSVSELNTKFGKETTYYNSTVGKGAILKSYSGQKLMVNLNSDNWKEKTKPFVSSTVELQNESKVIAGYDCKKAIVRLADETEIVVYFTPQFLMANTNHDYAFPTIKGIPVQFEIKKNQSSVIYTLISANFEPQLASVFNVPTNLGYRTMKWEDLSHY